MLSCYFHLIVHTYCTIHSVRELYPYQMKLASIDNMRRNGTFYDEDGMIPEGQGLCVAILNECYDILHDLIIKVGEDDSSGGDDQALDEETPD